MITTPQTRPQVIAQHWRDYHHATGTSMEAFAAAVGEHYCRLTPQVHRLPAMHCTSDAYADVRANAQTLRRMLDDDRLEKLPLGLEEALLMAFPEPWRSSLCVKLSSRLGLLAVPIPQADARNFELSAAELMAIAGKAFGAVAAVEQGGDESQAITEIEALMGCCAAIRAQLVADQNRARLDYDLNDAPRQAAH
jgi:hypothetical protein